MVLNTCKRGRVSPILLLAVSLFVLIVVPFGIYILSLLWILLIIKSAIVDKSRKAKITLITMGCLVLLIVCYDFLIYQVVIKNKFKEEYKKYAFELNSLSSELISISNGQSMDKNAIDKLYTEIKDVGTKMFYSFKSLRYMMINEKIQDFMWGMSMLACIREGGAVPETLRKQYTELGRIIYELKNGDKKVTDEYLNGLYQVPVSDSSISKELHKFSMFKLGCG